MRHNDVWIRSDVWTRAVFLIKPSSLENQGKKDFWFKQMQE